MENEMKDTSQCISVEEMVDCLAGEVDRMRSEGIRRHVKSCFTCRAQMKAYEHTAALLRTDSPSRQCNVADAVMAEIRRSSSPGMGQVKPFLQTAFKVALGIAAVLMVMIYGSGKFRRDQAPSPGPEGAYAAARSSAAGWLMSVQEPDGSWDPAKWGGREELRPSLTGLAVLSLQNSGADADKALKLAAGYLVSQQNLDGSIGQEGSGRLYNQGIATKALMELHKSGVISSCDALDKAVAYVLSRQLPSGGWSYTEDDAPNSVMGVSVWQLEALASAKNAGVGNVENGLRRGLAWLRGAFYGTTGFGYEMRMGSSSGMSPAVKAMGALCMFSAGSGFLGDGDMKKIREVLSGTVSEISGSDLYSSYFISSASGVCEVDDPAGVVYGVKNQVAQQINTHGVLSGSWSPDFRWGSVGGRIYTTSMAALLLGSSYTKGI